MADEREDILDERSERLLTYLEGGLAPAQREALEKDLAEQPDLAAELEALRRTDRLLGELGKIDPVPPERTEQAVWLAAARMRGDTGRAGSRPRRLAPMAVAAAIVLAAGAGYFLGSLREPQDSVTKEVIAQGSQPQVLDGWLTPLEGSETGGQASAGALLPWGQAFVADEPSRIDLGDGTELGLEPGAVVSVLAPADGQLRLDVSGGRWHLAGRKVPPATVVADGGTIRTQSGELEVVGEPAEGFNGGGAGPVGIALAVFSGVVTLSNPAGQLTLGAGEMATATVADSPVKRVWEPSVQSCIDALSRWYGLSVFQQYEVGQLLSELRREQDWLVAPHEEELETLRERMSRFWLLQLDNHGTDARQYLEDHARYRQLLNESPYRWESILAQVEAMLPAAQVSQAWSDTPERDRMAERLGVTPSVLRYVTRRYELTGEQLIRLEQYLRGDRPSGESLATGFDDLVAAVNAVVPAEQIRRVDRRAAQQFHQRRERRDALLAQLLPQLDWTQPEAWSGQVQQFARRVRLTLGQTDHARRTAEEITALALPYYESASRKLAALERQMAAETDPAERRRIEASRDELARPMRAWADRLRETLAQLPALEQLELAYRPTAMDEF